MFGKVAKLPSDGVPYFVFSYAGLLGWNAFSSTLSKASGSLVGNANLVSKVYFPRLVLPLSTVFSSLLDFAVALVMLAALMIAYRVAPGIGLLLLPVWLLLLLLLSIGVGLFAASLIGQLPRHRVHPARRPCSSCSTPVRSPTPSPPCRGSTICSTC